MYWPILVEPDWGSINRYAVPTDGVLDGVIVGVGVIVVVDVGVGVRPIVVDGVGVIVDVGVGVGVTEDGVTVGVGVGVGVPQNADGSVSVNTTPYIISVLVTPVYTAVVPVLPV